MKKTAEQLAKEMDEAIRTTEEMTEEEKIEYDAEYGYDEDDD